LKFAAIDIGSNAVRLLFSTVQKTGRQVSVKKADLIRVPVRLGSDVFTKGTISKKNEERLIKAMIAYRNLIDIHQPESYRACATSAMREAANGDDIIKRIKKEAHIKIDIIDGLEEAKLICNNYYSQKDQHGHVMFIDVGGGSTEISVFSGRTIKESCSFKLGTIRLLNNKENAGEWIKLRNYCVKIKNKFEDFTVIASGGNINKLIKFAGKGKGGEFSYKKLQEVYTMLSQYTYEERIKILGLNADRADVIIPAALIFLSVMEGTGVKKLHVPQIGLADGIVIDLYQQHIA
jgi:exopolyphosphatase / guanosine-5'-triphosphate,3'-diphosphate pyrophosphatase